jgi:hypothetical protein
MNNAYVMSASLETKQANTQASMITGGFAAFMILLMFLLRWQLPVFEQIQPDPGIDVEITLPEEPPTLADGGGGGGNPVQAAGPAGAAPYSPPAPGTDEDDAKDIPDNDDKSAPAIVKPDIPKPTATKINSNNSVVKTTPKPVETPPAPPKPKAVAGRTLAGNNIGGGAANDYQKSGGTGNGNGVGNGSGNGGGSGTGTGGGNGSGRGTGTGPRVTRGDRRIVSTYAFQGDLDKATVYADIRVTPDGVGQFMQFAKGTTATGSAYRTAITQYLRNMKFDKSDHESVVTVQFNFRVTN